MTDDAKWVGLVQAFERIVSHLFSFKWTSPGLCPGLCPGLRPGLHPDPEHRASCWV